MVFEITRYTSRTADEEVDTIEICPTYPDYMVFGTYALVGQKKEYEAQVRKGSIQVLPVSTTFKTSYAGMLLPKLAKQTFSAAVLDIRFHPLDQTLLGVATSDAKVHFFRFVKRGDVHERRIVTELLPLSSILVAPADEHGLIPLVTQFQWLPFIKHTGDPGHSMLRVVLAITLSSHEAKLIKVHLPGPNSNEEVLQLSHATEPITDGTAEVHCHDLEAWCTNTIIPLKDAENKRCLFFSGADDSKLIASMVDLDLTGYDLDPIAGSPLPLWTDKSTHDAGVTAILPIPALPSHTTVPLLTGSYDETLRLFELDSANNYRRKFVTDIKLHGGVWRLKLMDHYNTITDNRSTLVTTNYLVLISCMHAGAKIIRIMFDDSKKWRMEVEVEFTKGHETLVYACDFRHEDGDDGTEMDEGDVEGKGTRGARYTVVSTSFYDKKICTWEFVDEKKPQAC